MNYEEARNQIQTGDLIAVHGNNLLSLMTRLMTRSKVTHCGIAVWIEEGLFLAELNGGGNHLIPLSQLSYLDFEVYEPLSQDRDLIMRIILEDMRVHRGYGYWGLAVIGLLDFFRASLKLKMKELMVCSVWCSIVYMKAGAKPLPYLISPAKLAGNSTLKFSVQAS